MIEARPAPAAAMPPLAPRPDWGDGSTSPAPCDPPSQRGRLPFIDGLRGVAVLMVMLNHSWAHTIGVPLRVPVGSWQIDVTAPLRFGFLGVHLFLLLSGFCLTYPLARRGPDGLRVDLLRFFRRRARRILPPYYAAIALIVGIPALKQLVKLALGRTDGLRFEVGGGELIAHLLLVHNLFIHWMGTINGSFWSLALEWQLYMVFPLLVWGIRRWGLARPLAAVLLLTVSYRTWVYFTKEISVLGIAYNYAYALPGRLFEFALGMAAALALGRPGAAPSAGSVRRYRTAALLFGLLGLVVTDGWSRYAPVTDVIWGLAFFCLVMYAGSRAATGGGWLEWPPLERLGLISYSVYLIHEPIIHRLAVRLQPLHLSNGVTLLLFEGVGIPLFIAIGWVFFRLVEARFIGGSVTREIRPLATPKTLMVGAAPPPFHGSIMMFASLMASPLKERFRLLHLDISDHRDMDNIGRLDPENVRLALRHALSCYRMLRREQPEIVYVPVAMNPLAYLRDSVFLLLARGVRLTGGRKRRLVVHAHGGHFGEFYRTAPGPLRAYIRATLKGVDAAVVHSDSLAPMFAGLVPDERIWPVPNGIEGTPEHLRASKEEGERRPPTVLYLGTLVECKGFLDVMAAAPLVARAVPGVRFILAGAYFEASDREKAERLLQEDAIRAVVQLPGVVKGDAKYELLRDADVFVFPSYYPVEGQPTVLLEAMSAGLPVVTTDQGAIRDTIVDGETGYLVAKRDPPAIARRVIELLQDRPLRRRMGAAGRRRFETHFRVESYGDAMTGVFDAVLRGEGRGQ